MIEKQGDLWTLAEGQAICITTNPIIAYSRSQQGEVVMGRGVALQAKERFPVLPIALAARIRAEGNVPIDLGTWVHNDKMVWFRILTLPTKWDWKDASDPSLIRMSLLRLVKLVDSQAIEKTVFLPRPGCGNGRLDWKAIRPYCAELLDDQYVIVEHETKQGELL